MTHYARSTFLSVLTVPPIMLKSRRKTEKVALPPSIVRPYPLHPRSS